MVGLDEIKNSLDSNPYMTNDIKDSFMELIVLFNSKFQDVDLATLNERIKTLKVIRGSKFLIRNTSCYDPVRNEILISLTKLTDEVDCKHILMRELLNVITAKDNYTGFNKDKAFEALNIGYTEILTNYLVGNLCESEYEDEIIATNMIAEVIGKDTLYKAYFSNDASILMSMV